MESRRLKYRPLTPPFIEVNAYVNQSGITNGKLNVEEIKREYILSPSALKISTYIINQIFGSDIVTQTVGLDVGWLMPTLKEALEQAIYDKESFIYLNYFDNKVYLECIPRCEIFDLVQVYDKVKHCVIKTEYDTEETRYRLDKIIDIANGKTKMKLEAFEINKKNEEVPISIQLFNTKTGNDYEKDEYDLKYEILVNIDCGREFFKDSKKLLIEEVKILNVLADEIEKTRTRIATSQHFQSGDIVTSWKPASNFNVESVSVNNLQDYFTLLPGDEDHTIFEFLQGDVRVEQYASSFKFYDYQIIQMSGLSPASFGYEKDAYQNVTNIELSRNTSEMTIEAIKTQIEPQLNKLFDNIQKLQKSAKITINKLPIPMNWDYGSTEKFDDIKKIRMLKELNSVGNVPYSYRAKIMSPILNKLFDKDVSKEALKDIDDLIKAENKEKEELNIKFGEI